MGSTEFSDACSITWEVVGSVLNVIENVVPRWRDRMKQGRRAQKFILHH